MSKAKKELKKLEVEFECAIEEAYSSQEHIPKLKQLGQNIRARRGDRKLDNNELATIENILEYIINDKDGIKSDITWCYTDNGRIYVHWCPDTCRIHISEYAPEAMPNMIYIGPQYQAEGADEILWDIFRRTALGYAY